MLVLGLTACGGGVGDTAADRRATAAQQVEVDRDQEPRSPGSTRSPDSAYFSPERSNPRVFLRRWDAASDSMQVTGRTSDFVSMTSGCEPCDGFVKVVEGVFEAGGSVDFAGSRVVSIKKVSGSDSSFLLTKDVPLTVVRHADGRRDRYPGGRTTLRIVLKPDGETWSVHHYWIEPTRS